jgi:hypothetical protein
VSKRPKRIRSAALESDCRGHDRPRERNAICSEAMCFDFTRNGREAEDPLEEVRAFCPGVACWLSLVDQTHSGDQILQKHRSAGLFLKNECDEQRRPLSDIHIKRKKVLLPLDEPIVSENHSTKDHILLLLVTYHLSPERQTRSSKSLPSP